MYMFYAKVPLVILGCPFLDKQEKALLTLLINQKNIYRQKRNSEDEFKISQGRLQFNMGGMKNRSIIKLVNEKLKPTGFVVRFGVDRNDFYVELSDWEKHPWILYTSAVLKAMNPTEKKFNKKTESVAWKALEQVKKEEVMESITSLEEATDLVNKKLDAIIPTVSMRQLPKAAFSLDESQKWSDREFVLYFFEKYKEHTSKEHMRIKMASAEECIYRLRKYCKSDDNIARKHINAFLEAYTGRKGFDPKLMLLGDYENIYQVRFFMDNGVLASDYKPKKEKSDSEYSI